MTNPRDTGRYDAFTDSYVDTNVRIDFAWGNIPMQPNDDRGMATLDPELDSHIIATSGYEGFPAFITGEPFDDTVPNTEVPNVVGLTSTAAKTAITNAGLNWQMTTTATGATSQNNDKIKTQNPAAGTVLNLNDNVSIVAYAYVAVTTGPIASIISTDGALGADEIWMYLLGRTVKPTVGDFVTIAGNANSQFNSNNYEVLSVANDDAFNTGGTKVKLHCVTGTITPAVQATGGTWTKV